MFVLEEKDCKFCGAIMKVGKVWGDGYIEPKERVDVCTNCGAEYIQNQDTGKYWILKGEEVADDE